MTAEKTPVGIKYVSFAEPSGYGEAGRRYLLGLNRTRIPLTWTPLVPGRRWGMWYQPYLGSAIGDPELDHLCNKKIAYDTVIAHTVPEYFPQIRALAPQARFYGYTTWETTAIPKHWKPLLNATDGILVPCRWNAEVFRACGVTVPISVVPHISATVSSADTPMVTPLPVRISPEEFVFYSINTWTERKACWLTVRAYLNSFTSDDAVVLVLKTSKDALNCPAALASRLLLRRRYQRTRKILADILREYKNPARIILETGFFPREALVDLHQRGHCYVSLCRAEGWGIGAFDAAAHGNPVIITGFGGHLEYLSNNDSLLVRYQKVPVQSNDKSYTPDQTWAEPDLEHASRLMKEIFKNYAQIKVGCQISRQEIQRKFSEQTVTQDLLRSISKSFNS